MHPGRGEVDLIQATLLLYRDALLKAARSFVRCWMIAVAVVIFMVLLAFAGASVGMLGLLGGFLMGAANALLVGATLSLIEDAVTGARPIRFQDIWGSLGSYFWDVIGVLFILWVPMMLLERGMEHNPQGPVITSLIFFLLFIILNPAPEVIYQVRHGSSLDVIRESYEFVVENWIEWFLPLVLLALPLLAAFLGNPSGHLAWAGGLSFAQLLFFPWMVLNSWLASLGVPPDFRWMLVLVVTPPFAVFLLLFRGHLFAALHGTSRRQRMFRKRSQG